MSLSQIKCPHIGRVAAGVLTLNSDTVRDVRINLSPNGYL